MQIQYVSDAPDVSMGEKNNLGIIFHISPNRSES